MHVCVPASVHERYPVPQRVAAYTRGQSSSLRRATGHTRVQVFPYRTPLKLSVSSHPAPTGRYEVPALAPVRAVSELMIVFYEDRNFMGRSYECSSDCSDMSSYLSRCHSCRVESGCWMVYDRPNYTGNQYFIRRGEYSDYMSMWGMSNSIRSCRMIPMHRGSYRMRIYERENFMGQMMEVTEDCESIMERYHWSGGCHSCHVMDGHWLVYEQPQYRGRMWYFGPGEYRSFRDWGGMRFMSMRRIVDS
ncbi:hypothetical protein NFI96_011455 [Prochilodus magdalenae]|nr:hypothetical protein NFI96_011455 [Prochilodus magdalenae]